MILKKIKNKFLVPCILIGAVSMNLGFTNTVKANAEELKQQIVRTKIVITVTN